MAGFGEGQFGSGSFAEPSPGTFGSGTFGGGTFGSSEQEQGAPVDLALDLDLVLGTPVIEEKASPIPVPPPIVLNETSLLRMELTLTGTYELDSSPEVFPGPPTARAVTGVRLLPRTPAILNGRPVLPRYWAKSDSSLTANSSKFKVIPDPPPPPDIEDEFATQKAHRWLASDLALTGEWLETWAAHDGGPSWRSVFPYRPKLKAHVQYGKGSKQTAYTNGVFYNTNFVEHMWADLGSLPQPYTWLFCGIILNHPNSTYGHYLLDVGQPQKAGSQDDRTVRKDKNTNDRTSSRSLMRFGRTEGVMTTRTRLEDGVLVRARHDYAPRPKVWAGVFNGSNSLLASFDTYAERIGRGKVDAATNRNFVVGRSWGKLSDNYASQMLLFEIRVFKRALPLEEIRAQYRQMASTYKFNRY